LLSSRLLEQVFRTVKVLPPASILSVATALETEEGLSSGELRSRVLVSVALSQERVVLTALLAERERDVPPVPVAQVAAALRSSLHTKIAMERDSQIELVWTGPPSGMTFRRTDQALLQIIQEAKRDLLLITFAAYRVPRLLEALRSAVGRGVTVSFLGESAAESGGKVTFDAANAFGDVANLIHFYVWPGEKREADEAGNTGTLHAKCALADTDLLLVSSANLTEQALHRNMEMGLLVRGGPLPKSVRKHVQLLIASGHIIRS
jgi:cardiolipin synthase